MREKDNTGGSVTMKWLVGILCLIVGFFLCRFFLQFDAVASDVQSIKVKIASLPAEFPPKEYRDKIDAELALIKAKVERNAISLEQLKPARNP